MYILYFVLILVVVLGRVQVMPLGADCVNIHLDGKPIVVAGLGFEAELLWSAGDSADL